MSRKVLIAGLLLAAACMTAGCNRVPKPGGATGPRADQARKQAEALAVNAATGAAVAYHIKANPSASSHPLASVLAVATALGFNSPHVRSEPGVRPGTAPAVKGKQQPKALPRAGSPAVIQERISSSIPYTNPDDADDDVLNVAADLVEERLAKLDPPIHYRPSLDEVKHDFVRKESREVWPPDETEQRMLREFRLDDKVWYVWYDVEVTADQIRELRTRNRMYDALRVFAGIAAVALVGLLFLKLDERTKGYLTRWLGVAAVMLVGCTAAVLYFV